MMASPSLRSPEGAGGRAINKQRVFFKKKNPTPRNAGNRVSFRTFKVLDLPGLEEAEPGEVEDPVLLGRLPVGYPHYSHAELLQLRLFGLQDAHHPITGLAVLAVW